MIVVTSGGWALTLYQAAGMGAAMRGGMSTEGMAGMAMASMSAADWSLAGLAAGTLQEPRDLP